MQLFSLASHYWPCFGHHAFVLETESINIAETENKGSSLAEGHSEDKIVSALQFYL